MAYNRQLTYSPPTPMANINPNNDFWTNLGIAAGTIWGENYNRRGIEKSVEKGKNIADNYGSDGQPPTSYTDYITGNNGSVTTSDLQAKYFPTATTPEIQEPTATGSVTGPTYQPMSSPISIGSVNGGAIVTPNAPSDTTTGYFDLNRPKYSVASDTGATVRKSTPSYSAEDMQSQIRLQLMKDGRTQYQIEQAMQFLNPTIKARMTALNDGTFDDMYNTFIGQLQNSEVDQAGMTLAQMAKYDPQRAAALKAQLDRHYARIKNDEAMRYKIEALRKAYPNYSDEEIYRLALGGDYMDPKVRDQQKLEFAYAKRAGSGGGGNGGDGTAPLTSLPLWMTKPEYTAALNIVTDLEKRMAKDEKLSDTELSRLHYFRKVLEQMDNGDKAYLFPAKKEDPQYKFENPKHELPYNGIYVPSWAK